MVVSEGKNLIALFVVFGVWTASPFIPAWVTETQILMLILASFLIVIALVTSNVDKLTQ